MPDRIPLPIEPLDDVDAIIQYDKGAKYYMMPEYKYFVRKVLRRGIRSGRVLDIGTGSGLLAIELAKARGCNFDIVGLDIAPNMIVKARENARRAGVDNKIRFLTATAAELPFDDASFDLVISYASLHHWFRPVDVFNEIARITRDGGCAIIRDNKRVYANPAWRAVIWLMCRFMNKRHRENWPKVIMSSYTIPEIRDIVGRSRFRNCRIGSDFVGIDMCIETRKL